MAKLGKRALLKLALIVPCMIGVLAGFLTPYPWGFITGTITALICLSIETAYLRYLKKKRRLLKDDAKER